MTPGEQLAWGPIGPNRYAVALGDRAIGLVHGDEHEGFTVQRMDGTPVNGVFASLHAALVALYEATRPA